MGRPRTRQPLGRLPAAGRRGHDGYAGQAPFPHVPRGRDRRHAARLLHESRARGPGGHAHRRRERPLLHAVGLRLRLLGSDDRCRLDGDGVLPLHRPRRAEDRLLRGRLRRARRRLGQAVRLLARLGLGDDRLRPELQADRLAEERGHLPDLPRPLPQREHEERPGARQPEEVRVEQGQALRLSARRPEPRVDACARPDHADALGLDAGGLVPQLHGRAPELQEALRARQARRHGGAARPRLLRRRPGRDHAEDGVPEEPRRDRRLHESDLLGGLEPPLRHARLHEDRPVPGQAGRLREDGEGGAQERDQGAAGRRLQPHVVGQPDVRPLPQLAGDGRLRADLSPSTAGSSSSASRRPASPRRVRAGSPARPSTSPGSASTRCRS